MLLIKGTRKARIKVFHHHDRRCENCGDFDLTIGVFQDYYHVLFIPIMATGPKSTVIYCGNCGNRIRSDTLSKEYESRTRSPFYLYTGLLLVGLAIGTLVAATVWGTYERSMYISDPKLGDIYLVKAAQGKLDGYRFVRVSRIATDTLIGLDNHLLYLSYPSSFAAGDYFDSAGQVVFIKSYLKQLYKEDSIETIYRDYDNSTGFNRIN